MVTMTFVVACSKTFGRLPGQSLAEFRAELKALTTEDREYFRDLFRTIGIDATL